MIELPILKFLAICLIAFLLFCAWMVVYGFLGMVIDYPKNPSNTTGVIAAFVVALIVGLAFELITFV